MSDLHDTIMAYAVEYSGAHAAWLIHEKKVKALAASGDQKDQKHRYKLIHSEGVALSVARNQARDSLIAYLESRAVDAIARDKT